MVAITERILSCKVSRLLTLCFMLLVSCNRQKVAPGQVQDEALRAGRSAASMPAADDAYFHDMDGGIPLTVDEVKGRNTWIVWTGGNDRFWDQISNTSLGALDFLKTLSSYHGAQYKGPKYGRHNRWEYLGLVNEPCFDEATGPDPQRYGLWLDKRRTGPDCPPDPFEDEKKYPGIAIGARGKNLPLGSYYGYATGIVGLRLFANPDFDEAAARKWGDGKAYYEDPKFYQNKDLVKPYRVGMSCAFCHVGPNPVEPPADPDNPKWENLSSNVGAQYFWIDRIFDWDADPGSFVFQLFHTSRPGTLDTSLVSTDNINNPRTMNAVYNLGPRLEHAKRWGEETLAGGGLNNKQFNDFVHEGPLTQFFQAPDTVWTPRVLKDGSDSVGALGALNRVYLNIGLFSEEWLLHFNALIGGKRTSPIEIAVARKNSAYWGATEQQTVDMALFFLKSTAPHKLQDASGGEAYLTKNKGQLERGKIVFAERCARCHSSKLPTPAAGVDPGGCSGRGYLVCWNKYWTWTKTDDFKRKMRDIVRKDDFVEGNYLSSELRIPVTLLETNACSPLATNAIAGNIWDNFSSQTYKDLPSVGTITTHHPYTGQPFTYTMPAGGRGYTRPASLISVWSTAPFLLNNSVGNFEPQPSVAARMKSFQDSIEKMLWPETRDKDDLLGNQIPRTPGQFVGRIDRTTERSYLRVPAGYLPDALQPMLGFWTRWFPSIVKYNGIEIGPIPKGTPVDLLANTNLLSESTDPAERIEHDAQVVKLLIQIKHDLEAMPKDATDTQAEQVFKNLVGPLLSFSKCPDFEVNRGHYFGTSYFQEEPGLSNDDKRALIEFLKTF
jgi:hypothetical protein